MPDKKATYRINESMLRDTLLNYTVEVDAAQCSVIEQEASAIRMQKSFVMPETKVLVKFVGIPLLIIVMGIFLYANIDSIQSAFTPAPQPPVTKTEKKIVARPAVVKTPTVAVVNNTPPPVVNTVVTKHDLVIAAPKTPDSAKQQMLKKTAVPVIAGPPTDSATSAKPENTVKVAKADTASQRVEEPKKKKKKRRRRSDAYIEDVKENSLQPNSADDDVVVPQ